jgi:hypothetical protein
MSDKKKIEKLEVSERFMAKTGRYGDLKFFETIDEAREAAQNSTFSQGTEILVYQAVEKAVPNTKEVKIEKLT